MHGILTGRDREIHRLERVSREEEAQLVVVYGRRRVGKTYLIHHFFSGRFDFLLTGGYDQPRELQLRKFITELNQHTGEENDTPRDWMEAFELLKKYLSSLPTEENRVVFLDEMPWMDTPRSGFLSAFEWFWNEWGASQSRLIFIVCGSATAWMRENIDENRGGLFSRQTCRIFLEPFSLCETELYLKSRGINWRRADVAECYMILGGIPYYLRLLDPELPLNANIDQILFRKRAELWDEFDHLYQTLFTNSEKYIRVVEALSRKRGGMSRKEIAGALRTPENGELSRILNNLRDSGFVRLNINYANRKETLYQLADYYTMFYFRFIRDGYGKDERYWSNTSDLPARRAWAGLTFEQVCRDHIRQIKRKLEIGGVLSEEFTCRFRPGPEEEDGEAIGAQIDLLIDRRDQVINLCEMKYTLDEYAIDREEDKKLRNKIDRLQKFTKYRKTVQLTMVTTWGVKRNMYSNLVDSQVTLDDLFDP